MLRVLYLRIRLLELINSLLEGYALTLTMDYLINYSYAYSNGNNISMTFKHSCCNILPLRYAGNVVVIEALININAETNY
jgi:hypothetical protein